jgi:hypothetical protein
MTSDFEIYRTANILIREHGEEDSVSQRHRRLALTRST